MLYSLVLVIVSLSCSTTPKKWPDCFFIDNNGRGLARSTRKLTHWENRTPNSSLDSSATRRKSTLTDAMSAGIKIHGRLSVHDRARLIAEAKIDRGDIDGAYALLKATWAQDETDGWTAEPYVDLLLLKNDTYSALNTLREVNVGHCEGDGSSILLRSSLVSALNGQVYAGQADFVRKWLFSDAGGRMTDDSFLPKGDDPNSVAFLSAMAVMLRERERSHATQALIYGRIAWNLDRGNPWIPSTLQFMLPSDEIRDLAKQSLMYVGNSATNESTVLMLSDLIRRYGPSLDVPNSKKGLDIFGSAKRSSP